MSSTITFHNLFNVDVPLQLRSGDFEDCNQNPALPPVTVPANSDASIFTDHSVCFRRDLDPVHPTGQMTEWNVVNIFAPPADPQQVDINVE